MTLPAKNKFDPSFAISDAQGQPTQLFRDYMVKLDALVVALTAQLALNNLTVAADDAAAAAAGVPLGGLYRTSSGVAPHTISAIQIRAV